MSSVVPCLSDTLGVVGAYIELEIYFKNLLLQTSKKEEKSFLFTNSKFAVYLAQATLAECKMA